MEAHSTRLMVSSPKFLFNYTQIILFLKSHHFGKFSQLIFVYIIGYIKISWRPHNPPRHLHPKICGSRYPQFPRIDAYVRVLFDFYCSIYALMEISYKALTIILIDIISIIYQYSDRGGMYFSQ